MKEKASSEFVNHRALAKMFDVDTQTLKGWVHVGEWPEPHAIIRKTWLFRRQYIDHFRATGTWPEGAKFRDDVGRGRRMPAA